MATVPTCSPSLWIDQAQLAGPQRLLSKDPVLYTDTHRAGEMLSAQSHWPWEHNLWVNVCTVESQYHLNLTLLHFSCLPYMFKSFLCEVTCPKYTISPLFHPPSHPWFSWPISICLHQSYPLTRGLDSSMPATLRPPCPLPSLHLSLHQCVFTSAIQCCHCTLKWCSTVTHASWMW